MTISTVSTFFALLSLACWIGVSLVVLALVHRRMVPDASSGRALDDLAPVALWLAWFVAAVTTLGSLYYSEVAHFVPCKLCWYQRIAMYPLAITLLVAAFRRDQRVWWYVLPPAVVGAGFAAYHAQLQAFPHRSSFCTVTEPCTVRYVWKFGFVSLPFMALAAFSFVITMVLVAREPQSRSSRSLAPSESTTTA